MEGVRFFDITRMGKYEELAETAFNWNGNFPEQGERDANDYSWPIPITETSANKNIE